MWSHFRGPIGPTCRDCGNARNGGGIIKIKPFVKASTPLVLGTIVSCSSGDHRRGLLETSVASSSEDKSNRRRTMVIPPPQSNSKCSHFIFVFFFRACVVEDQFRPQRRICLGRFRRWFPDHPGICILPPILFSRTHSATNSEWNARRRRGAEAVVPPHRRACLISRAASWGDWAWRMTDPYRGRDPLRVTSGRGRLRRAAVAAGVRCALPPGPGLPIPGAPRAHNAPALLRPCGSMDLAEARERRAAAEVGSGHDLTGVEYLQISPVSNRD